MRNLKENETEKKRGPILEYFDELGRNTYYYNYKTKVWYEKSWIRLSNGLDVEVEVEGSNGYWRKHYYDIHTNELIKEIDINGNKNLLQKRRLWNPKDNTISKELLRTIEQSKKLF